MTINAFATEKVTRWQVKHDHALSMLSVWESRLAALKTKGKPQEPLPTADRLPTLAVAPQPRSVKFMPPSAVRTRADQAVARLAAMKEIAEAADKAGDDDAKMTPTSGKAQPAKKKAN
jgi:hypothetical protein